MGSDEDWEDATNGLKAALERLNMPYILNEGDGAFYGPKIDFHLRDSLGPVSYTHLDVYKRQPSRCTPPPCSPRAPGWG